MKLDMKKKLELLLNVVGYLTLYSIPYLLLIFYLVLHTPVKIACCAILTLIIIAQVIHAKKTKIKQIGIRILSTLVIIVMLTFCIHNFYGLTKTLMAQSLLQKVETISFADYTLTQKDLSNAKIQFVNEKTTLSKASWDSVIYYKNGTVEHGKVLYFGTYVYEINGDFYYIRNVPISFGLRGSDIFLSN